MRRIAAHCVAATEAEPHSASFARWPSSKPFASTPPLCQHGGWNEWECVLTQGRMSLDAVTSRSHLWTHTLVTSSDLCLQRFGVSRISQNDSRWGEWNSCVSVSQSTHWSWAVGAAVIPLVWWISSCMNDSNNESFHSSRNHVMHLLAVTSGNKKNKKKTGRNRAHAETGHMLQVVLQKLSVPFKDKALQRPK